MNDETGIPRLFTITGYMCIGMGIVAVLIMGLQAAIVPILAGIICLFLGKKDGAK